MKELIHVFIPAVFLMATGCRFPDNGKQSVADGICSLPSSSDMVTLHVTNAPITDVIELLNSQLSCGNEKHHRIISIRGAEEWRGEYFELPVGHDPFLSLNNDDWIKNDLTSPRITITRTDTPLHTVLDEIKSQHREIRIAVFDDEIIVLLQPPNVVRKPFDTNSGMQKAERTDE